MTDINPTITVDARGLNCPLPILKARKALIDASKNDIVLVMATDKTSQQDFPIFAKQTGYKLILAEVKNEAFYYYLQGRQS